MYNLHRRIHLYTAMVIVAFVLMYAITGFVVTHEWMFAGAKPTTTTRDVPFAYDARVSDAQLAEDVKVQYHLPGQPKPPQRQQDGTIRLIYDGVLQASEVRINPSAGTARIKATELPPTRSLVRLHRMHGYTGGWFFRAWAFAVDAVAASFILFALTGIYLWWKRTKHRTPGLIVLGMGVAFALSLMLTLMFSA